MLLCIILQIVMANEHQYKNSIKTKREDFKTKIKHNI
jgi:hypothetical protein